MLCVIRVLSFLQLLLISQMCVTRDFSHSFLFKEMKECTFLQKQLAKFWSTRRMKLSISIFRNFLCKLLSSVYKVWLTHLIILCHVNIFKWLCTQIVGYVLFKWISVRMYHYRYMIIIIIEVVVLIIIFLLFCIFVLQHSRSSFIISQFMDLNWFCHTHVLFTHKLTFRIFHLLRCVI